MTAPEHPFARAFHLLGLPTLAELVATGDLSSMSDTDIDGYARIAACVWSGAPFSLIGGLSGREEIAVHYGRRLAQIVAQDSTGFHVDGDGRAWLDDGDGQVEVTERRLRHWEAIFALAARQETATAFLDLVPASVRDAADAQADTTWEWAFDDIAGRLEP
jgi:hypothetical protein